MKISVNATALKSALSAVRGAVSNKPANPVHGCVRIVAGEGGRAVLTATSGTVAIEASAECVTDAPGEIVVDHGKLAAVVGLYDGALALSYAPKTKRLAIRAGRSEHTLACGDPADFPPIQWEPDGAPQDALVAPGEVWARGLAVVTHASGDPNRYGLNGVAVEKVGDEGLRIVATDGSRLAWCDVDCSLPIAGVSLPRKHLISVDTARTLARMAAAGGQFGLRLGARSASWAPVNDDGDAIPGARCWFLLVEGEFPDYRMVLPASFKRVVKVGAAALATALKGITLAADDKNNTVRASFEEARVLLAAQSATSTAAAEVDAEMAGSPMQTGVNGGYLADALALLGAVEVTLSMGHPLDPVVITDGPPATPTAETPRGVVVMPMRLD